MNADASETLRALLRDARVASLGTLHHGEPSVSMVPFAVMTDRSALVIHVSQLSSHTVDMIASPRVSVLLLSAADDVPPQALPRATVRADAHPLEERSAEYASARAAYLTKFPDAEPIFQLRDFSLFLLLPLAARVIGGFGRAATVSGDDLHAVWSQL